MPHSLRVIIIVVLLLNGTPAKFAQTSRSTATGNPYIKFSWGCTSKTAFPKKILERIVRSTMKEEGFEGFGTWGDRAVAMDLNGDLRQEYFVPLDCGGTGNCVWGVFASGPVRRLALITGKDLFVQKVHGRWSEIVVYSHFNAAEGSLTTYRISRSKYFEVSRVPINLGETDLQVQGGVASKLPEALVKAKPICESVE